MVSSGLRFNPSFSTALAPKRCERDATPRATRTGLQLSLQSLGRAWPTRLGNLGSAGDGAAIAMESVSVSRSLGPAKTSSLS